MSNKQISNGRYWNAGWQLIDGCTPCSPGCDNCWSAALDHRFHSEGAHNQKKRTRKYTFCTDRDGKFNGHIILHPDRLEVPLKRKKPTVWCIWNDLFHEDVPTSFIDNVLGIVSACPQHTFLVLTKRAHLIEDALFNNGYRVLGGGDSLPNLWIGVTVCNQEEADLKIPLLLKSWPGKKWISLEPLLSEIEFDPHWTQRIDAVILGGETGPHARPMSPDWVRSVRDQCQTAGVPFFLKYLNKKDGRILDGREHNELPWRDINNIKGECK